MDIDTPKYTLADAAQATGIPVATLRSWGQQGKLPTHPSVVETINVKRGETRRLSARTILAAAIAAEFGDLAPRELAFKAGIVFAHTGSESNEGSKEDRATGHLFEAGATYAVVFSNGKAAVVNDLSESSLYGYRGEEGAGFSVIEIDPIWHQVMKRLGLIESY